MQLSYRIRQLTAEKMKLRNVEYGLPGIRKASVTTLLRCPIAHDSFKTSGKSQLCDGTLALEKDTLSGS